MRLIGHLYKLTVFLVIPFFLFSCATIAGVNEPGPKPKAVQRFPYDRYVEGKPNMDMRVQGGFYVWRNGNSWHVRMAKMINRPKPLAVVGPIVTGHVKVKGGIIPVVTNQNVSPLDDIRRMRNNISFKFELRNDIANDVAGFDFDVKPTDIDYCVTVDLLVDGVSSPEIVHLGSFMHIPEELPLKICLRAL